MAYGIESIAPQSFGISMDLALTGPNVGCKYFISFEMPRHAGSC